MNYRNRFFSTCLTLLLVTGCSNQKQEDSTQKVIDSVTGKTQVDTYQQLQKQIKDVDQQKSKQFDELDK